MKVGLIAVALVVASPASSAYLTGAEVGTVCRTPYDPVGNLCTQHLMSLADATVHFSRRICPPRGTSLGQATEVVRQHIMGSPSQWHRQAADLAEEGLSRAFPCR